jgi:hypothetical protein
LHSFNHPEKETAAGNGPTAVLRLPSPIASSPARANGIACDRRILSDGRNRFPQHPYPEWRGNDPSLFGAIRTGVNFA